MGRRTDLQLAGDAPELAEQVHPLAHPQVVEELLSAHPPELVARQLALLRAQVVPQGDDRQQVGAVDLEAVVELVGLLSFVLWTLARVLDRQRRRDHQHLAHAAEPLGFEHHPPEPRVDRQAGEIATRLRQSAGATLHAIRGGLDRGEFVEQCVAVDDRSVVGRLDERELGHVTEPDRRHLEDDGRQVGPQDLGLGELGPGVEVVLGVEPDADAGRDAPAASGPLVGRRLRDRFDRESLHLEPAAVPRDARGAGVDDVAHARHGQRRLGDVGGEHDAATGAAARGPFEDLVLLD